MPTAMHRPAITVSTEPVPAVRASRRLHLWLLWALLAAYVGVFVTFAGLPWGDLPNHLTRITIISKLLFSSNAFFRQNYAFHWMFTPYILWDVLAAITGTVLPVIANGVLWTVITFLAVVAAGWYFAKVRLKDSDSIVVMTLLSVLLASDWFFAMGFFAYQLSFALSLVALAILHRVRRSDAPAIRLFSAYVLVAVACYLTHLGGFLALCLLAGGGAVASVLQDRKTFWRELRLLSPLLLLSAWQLASMRGQQRGASAGYVYGPLSRKVLALSSPWIRLPLKWDWPLVLGVFLSSLFLIFGTYSILKKQTLRTLISNELFLGFIFLVFAYVALPRGGGEQGAWDVDVRIVPYLFYFGFLWLCSMARKDASGPPARARTTLPVLILFAASALGISALALQLWPCNSRDVRYHKLLQEIPRHQIVLPVATVPNLGRITPTLQQGALYSVLREGIVPYIFNRGNAPIEFFGFRNAHRAPNIFSYLRSTSILDSCDCDYIVVTKPYDSRRLRIPGMSLVFQNDAAVVFRVGAPDEKPPTAETQ
jgi:hypothetical protein